jgi:hypothetical protein
MGWEIIYSIVIKAEVHNPHALLLSKDVVKIVRVVFMQTTANRSLMTRPLVCLPETDYGRFSYLSFSHCMATSMHFPSATSRSAQDFAG